MPKRHSINAKQLTDNNLIQKIVIGEKGTQETANNSELGPDNIFHNSEASTIMENANLTLSVKTEDKRAFRERKKINGCQYFGDVF